MTFEAILSSASIAASGLSKLPASEEFYATEDFTNLPKPPCHQPC